MISKQKLSTKILLALLVVGCMSAPLAAERLRVSNWKYYKNISNWSKVDDNRMEYARIEMDDEISQHSSGYDIRIGIGERALPFFLRPVQLETSGAHKHTVKILFQKQTRYGRETVLEIPETAAGFQYRELILSIPEYFESGLTLYQGANVESLVYAGSYSLYAYSDGNHRNRIPLDGDSSRRFLRLIVEDNKRVRPLYALSTPVSKSSEKVVKYTPEELEIEVDEDAGQTRIYIPNASRRPVHRILLQFAPRRFSRRIEVSRLDSEEKQYLPLFSSMFVSTTEGSSFQNLTLYNPSREPLKIVIEDRDNDALVLEGLQTYMVRQELLFDVGAAFQHYADAGSMPLRIYYGNDYVRRPGYDLPQILDEKAHVLKLKTSTEIKNADFAYSLVEPPISTWIIRVIFLLGLLLVAFPAYKVMRVLGDTQKKSTDTDT